MRNNDHLRAPHVVYLLVWPPGWPREGEPFYVGISSQVDYRFYTHTKDRCSAPYAILNDLLLAGETRDDILVIEAEGLSHREAVDLEYQLVCELPYLVNRDKPKYIMNRVA